VKPDSMLVRGKDIRSAKTVVRQQGATKAQEAFAQLEPALAKYIDNRLCTIAGQMVLAGASTEFVNCVSNDVMGLIHTALSALRSGHYRLWKKTAFGKRLAELDPSLPVQSCGCGNEELLPPPDAFGKGGCQNYGDDVPF